MIVSDGLVSQRCTGTVPEVLARLRVQLVRRHIHLVAVIDHGQAAAAAGLELPDEVVAIFGAPLVGTQLMLRNPRVGIELPSRMLIWDDDGTTLVAFTPPETLAARFALQEPSLPIETLSALLQELSASIKS